MERSAVLQQKRRQAPNRANKYSAAAVSLYKYKIQRQSTTEEPFKIALVLAVSSDLPACLSAAPHASEYRQGNEPGRAPSVRWRWGRRTGMCHPPNNSRCSSIRPSLSPPVAIPHQPLTGATGAAPPRPARPGLYKRLHPTSRQPALHLELLLSPNHHVFCSPAADPIRLHLHLQGQPPSALFTFSWSTPCCFFKYNFLPLTSRSS
jgi:hypothetical protein